MCGFGVKREGGELRPQYFVEEVKCWRREVGLNTPALGSIRVGGVMFVWLDVL